MQRKQIVMGVIALAVINAVLGIISGKWYLIAAAILPAVIALAGAVKYLGKPAGETLRSFSWHGIIAGLSTLSLALSSFYGLPSLGFLQVILSIAMVLACCYTLYEVVKVEKLEIIP